MNGFPMPIEDQYGPCRVGPAYPFFFSPDMLSTYYSKYEKYPNIAQDIVFQWYHPVETTKAQGAIWRVPAEIDYLYNRIHFWEMGISEYEQIFKWIPEHKKTVLLRELSVGCYICNTLKTSQNIKKWWLLNSCLTTENNLDKILQILDDLLKIIEDENKNTATTIPLVKFNSALGFECAMNYSGDETHLQRKKNLLHQLVLIDIPEYRKIVIQNKIP